MGLRVKVVTSKCQKKDSQISSIEGTNQDDAIKDTATKPLLTFLLIN